MRASIRILLGTVWIASVSFTPSGVRAAAGVHAYALVIGSNRGGDGQAELAFAAQDAERVSELLGELGRTPREHIELLIEPSSREVERALGTLREKLAAHAAKGERAQLVFYYSGHARAHALSLGAEELSLASLREQLLALPSTLTVVVLDACQSGAFSGVKGAAPAADFSVSSVHDLQSSGIAVMASSTGTELSQESRELGSSYFTHHLLVGLRGPGDVDRNGRVSLDEAYHYAYEHTLLDTARTQVGSQHATLETALTGRGDVPLSYPVDADAQLALPAALAGRVLVQRAQGGPVVAELIKASGAQLVLALPSGRYELLVRGEAGAQSCQVTLQRGVTVTVAREQCNDVVLTSTSSKTSEAPRDARPPESWFAEAGFYVGWRREDAYLRRLHSFGYFGSTPELFVQMDAALGIGVGRYLGLVARVSILERGDLQRDLQSLNGTKREETLHWRARSAALGLRGRLPLARHYFVLFGELDAGISHTYSEYVQEHVRDRSDRKIGPFLRAAAGFTIGFSRHFGVYVAGGFAYAPVLENGLGEVRDAGGFSISHGLRLNGVKGWW